ncbi:Putative uncharacterized protein [Taphrina deformans PYCC 5710]|uniref:Methyltransferase n=1 Tax=Taphrina deformans (strain PYCC 5710 / ATCC 11124 / CBS 356.35 / IMI 108563 / JCM 9778 / NBRC 8474) TaxID=1097556 RepID=R4X994_TAPDE|nr:Putative uncharacterized protein [Taphrina deformans PYCC 5710]|eukprot:CCG80752.1 Putative uncharacterized protein [Taphrina deformans PYCC 5710]
MVAESSIRANLVYATRTTDDGKKHWVEGGATNARSNFQSEDHISTINDLSARDNGFVPNLDDNGFEVQSLTSKETAFTDDVAITSHYYKEIEDYLLEHCGAARVFIFDHTVRRPGTNRGPVPRTHVDQTTRASIARVNKHLPGEADALLKRRFQIINVWRPISHPAYTDPLALCDYRSLGEGDMIESDRIDFAKPDAPPGETYAVAYNPNHRWYYHKDLDTSQVILIKCYDSKPDVAKFCPHTAFKDDTSASDKPARQSIELRALVFY